MPKGGGTSGSSLCSVTPKCHRPLAVKTFLYPGQGTCERKVRVWVPFHTTPWHVPAPDPMLTNVGHLSWQDVSYVTALLLVVHRNVRGIVPCRKTTPRICQCGHRWGKSTQHRTHRLCDTFKVSSDLCPRMPAEGQSKITRLASQEFRVNTSSRVKASTTYKGSLVCSSTGSIVLGIGHDTLVGMGNPKTRRVIRAASPPDPLKSSHMPPRTPVVFWEVGSALPPSDRQKTDAHQTNQNQDSKPARCQLRLTFATANTT